MQRSGGNVRCNVRIQFPYICNCTGEGGSVRASGWSDQSCGFKRQESEGSLWCLHSTWFPRRPLCLKLVVVLS